MPTESRFTIEGTRLRQCAHGAQTMDNSRQTTSDGRPHQGRPGGVHKGRLSTKSLAKERLVGTKF
jgi:hypothetical protein